jgi:hypothetical protein
MLVWGMTSLGNRQDHRALKRLINQADLVLATIPNPHPSIASARESLNAAIRLADALAEINPAITLGSKGGTKTAERGSEHFKKLAAMRKTRAGGRPRKTVG